MMDEKDFFKQEETEDTKSFASVQALSVPGGLYNTELYLLCSFAALLLLLLPFIFVGAAYSYLLTFICWPFGYLYELEYWWVPTVFSVLFSSLWYAAGYILIMLLIRKMFKLEYLLSLGSHYILAVLVIASLIGMPFLFLGQAYIGGVRLLTFPCLLPELLWGEKLLYAMELLQVLMKFTLMAVPSSLVYGLGLFVLCKALIKLYRLQEPPL